MRVNKDELIAQLRKRFHYTKDSATAMLEDFTTLILENLEVGNVVSIKNLGQFKVIERKARVCPSFTPGEMYEVPSHYIVRFYPYKQAKLAAKKWEAIDKEGQD